MKRLLLTGAAGQVGTDLRPLLERRFDVTAVDRAELDLTDIAAVRAAVRALRPDVIVNAAAYTAVDRAETDEPAARAVNAVAPAVLAEEAAALGARVVHYSTDYVYDGTKRAPYTETDAPNPLGVYGRTKLEGDAAVAASGADHLILRTSWVYGRHGHNFLKTMLRLADEGRTALRVVADQHGTPTWSGTIADATAALLDAWRPGDDRSGVYHLTNEGATTWHGFAEALFRVAGRPVTVEPISTADYPTPAARPAYSVLDKAKLRTAFGLVLPTWDAALRACLALPVA